MQGFLSGCWMNRGWRKDNPSSLCSIYLFCMAFRRLFHFLKRNSFSPYWPSTQVGPAPLASWLLGLQAYYHTQRVYLCFCLSFHVKNYQHVYSNIRRTLVLGASSRVRGSVWGEPRITKCPALRVTLFIPLLICLSELSTFPNAGEFLAPK